MATAIFEESPGFYSPIVTNNFFIDGFTTSTWNKTDPEIVLAASDPDRAYVLFKAKPGQFTMYSSYLHPVIIKFYGYLLTYDLKPGKINYLGFTPRHSIFDESQKVVVSGSFDHDTIASDLVAAGKSNWAVHLFVERPQTTFRPKPD